MLYSSNNLGRHFLAASPDSALITSKNLMRDGDKSLTERIVGVVC